MNILVVQGVVRIESGFENGLENWSKMVSNMGDMVEPDNVIESQSKASRNQTRNLSEDALEAEESEVQLLLQL